MSIPCHIRDGDVAETLWCACYIRGGDVAHQTLWCACYITIMGGDVHQTLWRACYIMCMHVYNFPTCACNLQVWREYRRQSADRQVSMATRVGHSDWFLPLHPGCRLAEFDRWVCCRNVMMRLVCSLSHCSWCEVQQSFHVGKPSPVRIFKTAFYHIHSFFTQMCGAIACSLMGGL